MKKNHTRQFCIVVGSLIQNGNVRLSNTSPEACGCTIFLDAEGEQYVFNEMRGMSTSFVLEVCALMGNDAESLGIGFSTLLRR